MTDRVSHITADLSNVASLLNPSKSVGSRSTTEIVALHAQQDNGKYLDLMMENSLEHHIDLLTSCADYANVDT